MSSECVSKRLRAPAPKPSIKRPPHAQIPTSPATTVRRPMVVEGRSNATVTKATALTKTGQTSTQPLPPQHSGMPSGSQSQHSGRVAAGGGPQAVPKATQITSQGPQSPRPTVQSVTGSDKSIYEKLVEDEIHLPRPIFTGYPCLEDKSRRGLLSARYRMDNEPGVSSINKNPRKVPTVKIGSQREPIIGVNTIHKGMTLGEAIQNVVMIRNREENARPAANGKDMRFTRIPDSVLTNKCLPALYIGDIVDSTNVEGLASRKIEAILSIHPIDFRSARQRELGYNPGDRSKPIQKIIELEDNSKADFISEATAGIKFIDQHRRAGRRVLVHCAAGRSRSYAFIQGYLTWEKYAVDYQSSINPKTTDDERRVVYEKLANFTQQCFNTIKVERPVISMDNFGDQIDEYTASLVKYQGFYKKKRENEKKTPSLPKKKGGEKGGGGWFIDSVVITFFVYEVRPTRQVIMFYKDRRSNYNWPLGLNSFYSTWAGREGIQL